MRRNQGWFWLKPRHWIPCSARLWDSAAWCQAWVAWEVKMRIFNWVTRQATNISPTKTLLKIVFLFQRWNLLVSWRVLVNQAPKTNSLRFKNDAWEMIFSFLGWPVFQGRVTGDDVRTLPSSCSFCKSFSKETWRTLPYLFITKHQRVNWW